MVTPPAADPLLGLPHHHHHLLDHALFKGDEGYSEDTRSQDDGDSTMGIEPRFPTNQPPMLDPLPALYEAIMGLDEVQRSEHAYNVLRTLRTSSIAAIVERLTPLLHLDPVAKLPPDITSMLFSYLEPANLLQASLVSKAWRERTLDTVLWRYQFRREGWTLNMDEVRRFERNYQPTVHKSLSRKATDDDRRRSKRPLRDGDIGRVMSLREGHATAAAPTDGAQDQEMRDAPGPSANTNVIVPSFDRMDTDQSSRSGESLSVQTSHESAVHDTSSPVEARDPPVLTRSYSGGARVNFHHVYKQKRRLEENWAAGRYKSFQLPHRDHPEEAHSECVYTIQYAGNYLVSGSRDKTLRIWNLDTQRLVRRPLEGHKASVLCLQFDASAAEDIIVSGSSDTDVIIWQFSSGKMLKRIQNAHRESVLNLKFDQRFLVTCSKDKMIKIWNRQALLPGHADYPRKGVPGGGRCPSYVLDWTQLPSPLELERMVEMRQIEAIPEYSLIMKIDDHGAAVNAVHIFEDQLVSASGDRALRVFNIHSGVRTATCKGHTKGIACVQYDGRRIVSGSSDNTIRIFDPKSQAEVACLQGHNKLVRTVQASFGDVPGSEGDLEKEARAADHAFLQSAGAASAIAEPHRAHAQRARRERERRERGRPAEHTTIGAKLPPGGGGSGWARIVSGSYDETIIIWKRGVDGRWSVAHTLRQADALKAAGGPLLAQSDEAGAAAQQTRRMRTAMAAAAAAAGNVPGGGAGNGVPQGGQFVPFHPVFANQQQQQQQLSTQMAQANLQSTANTPAPLSATQSPTHAALAQAPPAQFSWPPHTQAPPNTSPAASALASPAVPLQSPGPVPVPPPLSAAASAPQGAAAPAALPAPAGSPLAAATAAASATAAAANQHPNARVFKLQFDARRIICCSQDPKIVGWDFAAGDGEIEEVAGFFGGPA